MARFTVYRTSDGAIVGTGFGDPPSALPEGCATLPVGSDPETQKVVDGQVVDKIESELVAVLKVKRVAEIKVLAHALLSRTDWKRTRHRDQLDAGAATDLTDTEYQDMLAARQDLRDLSTQLEAEVNAKLKVSTIMAVDLSQLEALA
ncbi:MAG: hypothetical protein KJ621_05535 [Proteobacteria bacterium]|nr:hypothetical protein [Pseudomonadota bacterium]MBU1740851.1 hypothetical protein [Pseudomonadota bacterium]